MKSYTEETWPFHYYVKPCNLDPKMIYNLRGPESYGPKGWDSHSKSEKKKAAQEITKKMDEDLENWFSNLEYNILSNGFYNPIIVHAGWFPDKEIHKLPKKHQKNPNKAFALHNIGGTRLYIAQTHGLEVPCIVCDFNNLVPGIQPVYSPHEVKELFTSPPLRIDFKPHGIILTGADKDL